MIMADAAYDTREIRNHNRKRGTKSNIPMNKRNTKKQGPGRPKKFDKECYKNRNAIKRFFSWIESFRKIFPRYEVLEESYLGLTLLSSILILWRVLG